MIDTPAMVSPSDEQIARRAQRGCAASFEELMRRFQAPVLQFLRHRGPAAEAEDLLQETFVRAYTRLGQYRGPWRFSTWLFTIARRVSINHHRRTQRAPWPRSDGEAVRSAASTAPGPAETAARADSRQYLWARAAAVLSEEQWTALWLHYVENLPTRQIAGVLGCSRVALKTMIHRARKKLMPLLQELQPDGPALAETGGKKGSGAFCRDQPSVGARPSGARHKRYLTAFSDGGGVP
ncbi:MAG: sigma-70 family RNA polymerase sigma factor [Thermoguttaceae bacterium]|jgi:RNA polymerase sigma-70 factor (ECF subfamily)